MDKITHRWDALASQPDDELSLLDGSVLIARDEYPDLNADAVEAQLQSLTRRARRRCRDHLELDQQAIALSRFLFDECGFRGNQEDYYDPRNSYLNDVLERRLGIPISLAVLQLEVARRLGLPLQGVSFPGHYLVRLPVEGGLLVLDPYQFGRSLDAGELKLRVGPHLGGAEIDDRQLLDFLQPSNARATLMRMLRNLKAVYSERNDLERALRCSDRLLRLAPTVASEWRDRGLMYLRAGHVVAARSDLAHYLWLRPDAEDAAEMHALQTEAEAQPLRIN
jgi:regulator of sirC expression with transglutaminase-like and TPR domain